jgi:hypothetical protein
MTNSAPEVESQPAGLSEHKAFSKAARRAKKSTPKPTHQPEEKTPPAGQEAPSPGGNGLKPYSLDAVGRLAQVRAAQGGMERHLDMWILPRALPRAGYRRPGLAHRPGSARPRRQRAPGYRPGRRHRRAGWRLAQGPVRCRPDDPSRAPPGAGALPAPRMRRRTARALHGKDGLDGRCLRLARPHHRGQPRAPAVHGRGPRRDVLRSGQRRILAGGHRPLCRRQQPHDPGPLRQSGRAAAATVRHRRIRRLPPVWIERRRQDHPGARGGFRLGPADAMGDDLA